MVARNFYLNSLWGIARAMHFEANHDPKSRSVSDTQQAFAEAEAAEMKGGRSKGSLSKQVKHIRLHAQRFKEWHDEYDGTGECQLRQPAGLRFVVCGGTWLVHIFRMPRAL